MARRMAMSDADVMRLLAQDKKEYIEYPPERGDRYYEEDEIDEQDLAQMIMEHGERQGQLEALAAQGLAYSSREAQGDYITNRQYKAIAQAVAQRLIDQGVDPFRASSIASRLSEYA